MSEGIERDAGSGDDEHFILEKLTEIAVFLILGAGFTALWLGYGRFWIVFVIGFAVVLPLVHVVGELLIELRADGDEGGAEDERDPLDVLKERYARGEIDEAEFERRLELLVDADSPTEARARLEARRESQAADRDVELERE